MRPYERIALLNSIGRNKVAPLLPPGEGFCLMLFPTNQSGSIVSYFSNAERRDMHEVLRTLVDKWDREAKEGQN